jgi:hypothetical protein
MAEAKLPVLPGQAIVEKLLDMAINDSAEVEDLDAFNNDVEKALNHCRKIVDMGRGER